MNEAKRTCPECGLDYTPKGKRHGCPHCLLRLAIPGAEPSTGAAEPALPPGLKSRFFADYEILEELARGGMGVVYKARQMSLNRDVALKMIQAGHLLSTEARLRFRVEIEAVAQLNHPNIVSLYESDEREGIHYFTMRLVEGGNLSERLETPRPIRENVGLLIKVCRTIHYAHQRGVLHRDLKPSNILIDLQGEPHVADFGLAKSLDQETGFTYTSSILGSPNYMAPEQATSHSGPVSTAADVYGLGAILYQMLSGRPPFQGRTALETVRQVVDTEPVPPRRLNPQVDADLATICLKCLEKKPGDRYESAEDLARDLDSWLLGRPIQARPVGVLGTLWRWSKRHPGVTALSCALALALAGVMIGLPIAALRIREAQRDAVSHLRVSLLDQVQLLRFARETSVRTESLRLLRQAVDLGDITAFKERARDDLLAAVAFTDLKFSPQSIIANLNSELCLMDPRFERIAFVADRTNLVMRTLAGGAEIRRSVAEASTILQLDGFSPDGRFLVLRHEDGLSFWDTSENRLTQCYFTNGASRVYAFAPGAPHLYLAEADDRITVLELPSLRVVRQIQCEAGPAGEVNGGWQMLSASPDGMWLAAGRRTSHTLELIELSSGKKRWSANVAGGASAVAWQPTYGRLLAVSADGLAHYRNCQDGEPGGYLRLIGPVRGLAIDPSNTLLATAGEDRVIRLWNLGAYRQIFNSQGDARQLQFDQTGVRVGGVHRGDAAGWLDLARSSEYQEMVVGGSNIERCQFSPDGRIVAGGFNGQIDLRRASDGWRLMEITLGLPVFDLDPLGEGIVTSDQAGVVFRRMNEEAPGRIAVYPPRVIVAGPRWRAVTYSGNGQRFYAANGISNRVYAFDRSLTNPVASFGPHKGVDLLASDHRGRFVATGSSVQRDVMVWDTEARTVVRTASLGQHSRFALSPDGGWLLIHGDRFELLNLTNAQASLNLPFPGARPMTGPACFSSDGRVLAVVVDQSDVQLFDLKVWRQLGRLRPPREAQLTSLAFSRDGSELAAGAVAGRLRVWNLAQMRRQLAELNLDWDDAPFPMAPIAALETGPVPPPVELIEHP